MSLDLGALQFKITADSSQATQELNKVDNNVEKSKSKWSKIGGGLAKAGKVAAVGVAAIGTAAIGATTAIFGLTKQTAEYGDNVDKLSQKLGMTYEGFQEWDYILGQNGASIDGMKGAMKTLTSESEATNQAFATLGLTITDSMSQEEIFAQSVEALQNMEDGTEKAKLAQDLFGKSAQELMPLLNGTAEGTEELRKRAHELGLVMSDDAVKNSAAFGDALDDLKGTISGLSRGLVQDLMPSMTEVMLSMSDMLTGKEGAAEALNEGIENLIGEITEKIPKFLETGATMLTSILNGIIQTLPSLISGVMTIIPTIIDTVVGMIPQLIPVAVDMVLALIKGIVEGLPQLIDTAMELINSVLDVLINNLPLIIEAGIEIIIALIEGVVEALPMIIEQLPVIIEKIVEVVTTNLPLIVAAAITIIEALIKGIIQTLPVLAKNVPAIIQEIVNGIGALAGSLIDVGKNIVNWIWDGLKATWHLIVEWIEKKIEALMAKLNPANWFGGGGETSHRIGFEYVPYDNYSAILHKGEKVLTANEAKEYDEAKRSGGGLGEAASQTIEVIQNIFAPTPTPSEIARQTKNELKNIRLAMA